MTGCFDPTGTKVLTGSRDKFILTWPVEASVLANRACAYLNRNMTVEEWNEFVGVEIPYQKTCPNID